MIIKWFPNFFRVIVWGKYWQLYFYAIFQGQTQIKSILVEKAFDDDIMQILHINNSRKSLKTFIWYPRPHNWCPTWVLGSGWWNVGCRCVGERGGRQVVMADIITHSTVPTTVTLHTVTSGLSQPSEPESTGEGESWVSKIEHITVAVMVKG